MKPKFDIGKQVFIKSQGKIGSIESFTASVSISEGISIRYKVAIQGCFYGYDYGLGSSYIKMGPVDFIIEESDLEIIPDSKLNEHNENIRIENDLMDAYLYVLSCYNSWYPISYSKLELEELPCSHSWKSYQGFTEQYNFCEKCDFKDVN